MRVLILTDSLGCPRKEIGVASTWTEMVLSDLIKDGITVYTYCTHGLSAKMIDLEYVADLKPDIIISQYGIVDACRRVMSRTTLSVVSRIPKVSGVVREFCDNNHYKLSSIRELHYCKVGDFGKITQKISELAGTAFLFVAIAPAGARMKKKAYMIENDIDAYNTAARDIAGVTFIDPYRNQDVQGLLLHDGHHLTEAGHALVHRAVIEGFTAIKNGGSANE